MAETSSQVPGEDVKKAIIIVRAVCTSVACPSQWDAWDADGNYYYLRYRHGVGTVERKESPESDFFERHEDPGTGETQYRRITELVARFEDDLPDDAPDGYIELAAFVQKTGLSLAENSQIRSFDEYMAFHLATALKETYPEEWAARYGDKEPQL